MLKQSIIVLALVAIAASATTPVLAGRPGVGQLYYDGMVVRTIVPPAAMPHEGVDNLYAIMGGVGNQLAVAAVAPGKRDHVKSRVGPGIPIPGADRTRAPRQATRLDAVLPGVGVQMPGTSLHVVRRWHEGLHRACR